MSKITKYRVSLGFDPSVARLLGHDSTPRPTCPVSAMSEAGKYLFKNANVGWRCAQYFVSASCSDCVGVCRNVCCVETVVKDSVFSSLAVLKYVVCLCKGCDGCCVFLFVL